MQRFWACNTPCAKSQHAKLNGANEDAGSVGCEAGSEGWENVVIQDMGDAPVTETKPDETEEEVAPAEDEEATRGP